MAKSKAPKTEQDRTPILFEDAPSPQPRRRFRTRTLPLDGGFDVTISGEEAFEDEFIYRCSEDELRIITGPRARAMKQAGEPVELETPSPAAAVPPQPQGPKSPHYSSSKVAGWDGRGPRPPGFKYPEATVEPDDKPRAPRDRTAAQRRALRASQSVETGAGEMEVSLPLDLEAIAGVAGAQG